MQSYQSARNLFSFMSLCAWCLIVTGAILAFVAAGYVADGLLVRSPSMVHVGLATIPGGLLALTGFLSLSLLQMGRASVDTAEYAQQSLKVSRQHMELSQQLLEQGKTTAASFASLKLQPTAPTSQQSDENAAAGASYADQPSAALSDTPEQSTPAALPAAAATAAAGAATASPTKAITQEEQIPLEPLASDIVYKDGKYLVGDKPFWSKKDALAYQQTLLPAASK